MLNKRIVGDTLWQCLCPQYPRLLALTVLRARLSRPARQTNTSRPTCRSQHQACRSAPEPSLHRLNLRPCTTATAGSAHRYKSNLARTLERQTLHAQDTSTDDIYRQLGHHAKQGRVRSVEQLVEYLVRERHEAPNLRLYGPLILSNISPEHGSALRVKALLHDLIASGLSIDTGICHVVIKVLSVHLDYILRNDILEYMRQRWMALTPLGYHYVVAGLLREGQLNLARKWLQDMADKSIHVQGWLQELTVYAFLDCGEIDSALALVRSRWERGERAISASVWSHLLDVGSAAYHHPSTLYVWNRQVNLGQLNPSAGVCLDALTTAADAGDVHLATDIFALLGKRSTVFQAAHYEQLQKTYLNARPPDLLAALNVLMLMAATGLKATSVDTRPLFEHLKNHPSDIGKSLKIFHRMKESDQAVPIAAVNVAIEVLIQAGEFDEALAVYDILPKLQSDPKKPFATMETFNHLLLGARSTEPVALDQAEFLTSEVQRLGLKPDQLFYDRMILVCNKAANLEAAWRYCDAMARHSWRPRPGTAKELTRLSIAEGSENMLERCRQLSLVCPELRTHVPECEKTASDGARAPAHLKE